MEILNFALLGIILLLIVVIYRMKVIIKSYSISYSELNNRFHESSKTNYDNEMEFRKILYDKQKIIGTMGIMIKHLGENFYDGQYGLVNSSNFTERKNKGLLLTRIGIYFHQTSINPVHLSYPISAGLQNSDQQLLADLIFRDIPNPYKEIFKELKDGQLASLLDGLIIEKRPIEEDLKFMGYNFPKEEI